MSPNSSVLNQEQSHEPSNTENLNLTSNPPNQTIPVKQQNLWSHLFGGGAYNNEEENPIHYPDLVLKEGVLVCPQDIREKAKLIWADQLVGMFLENPPPFSQVKIAVERRWRPKGSIEVTSNGEYFLLKFTNQEDRDVALETGPFKIRDKLMVTKPWKEDLTCLKKERTTIPVWIHMYNVPTCMWTKEGLSYIGSMVGKPVRFYRATATRTILTYAAICVEVKADKELPEKMKLDVGRCEGDVEEVVLDYPWKPQLCPECCSFGHLKGKCMEDVTEKVLIQKSGIFNRRKSFENRNLPKSQNT